MRVPASTTVMPSPGFSSASFSAAMAAEMPPPMMQTSDSWSIPGPGEAAALIAVNRRAVAEVVGGRRVEVVSHQIRGDMTAVGAGGQALDLGRHERRPDERPALLRHRPREALGAAAACR